MKTTRPTSVPDGVSSSAGISVSTAAEMKAHSVWVRVSLISGSGAAVAAVFTSGLQAAMPVAIAAPAALAAPALFKKSRRGILTSAMNASQELAKLKPALSVAGSTVEREPEKKSAAPGGTLETG